MLIIIHFRASSFTASFNAFDLPAVSVQYYRILMKSMFNKLIFIGTICIPNSMQHPEGLNIRYEINSSSRAWWNIFIDLSIQSETPPAVYFLSDHLQEQEGDVYSHGDAWDGRVMAPCHAPSLWSSDFVSLHVWPNCWLGALSLTSWLFERRSATECRMLELRWELWGRRSGVRYALEIICSARDAPHTMSTSLLNSLIYCYSKISRIWMPYWIRKEKKPNQVTLGIVNLHASLNLCRWWWGRGEN